MQKERNSDEISLLEIRIFGAAVKTLFPYQDDDDEVADKSRTE